MILLPLDSHFSLSSSIDDGWPALLGLRDLPLEGSPLHLGCFPSWGGGEAFIGERVTTLGRARLPLSYLLMID